MASLTQLYHSFKRRRGRRIFIMPTRFGYLFAAFLLLILIGAINYNNSLGYALCFLLASLGQLSTLYIYRNLAKIDLVHATSSSCFCGQAVSFNLVFTNPEKRDSYNIELSSKQYDIKSWNPFKKLTGYQHPSVIDQLKNQQNKQVIYSLPTEKRGEFALGRLQLASTFPLGLFNTWTYFKTDCKAIVYPTPKGSLPLPFSSEQAQQEQQQHQQKGLDEFSGFANYRQGDPMHRIAWKALARDDVIRTKQFTSPNQSKQHHFTWQDVDSLKDTEAKLSQLCQWIIEAHQTGANYGLNLPSSSINTGSGDAHYHHCLSALARYN
jgi:uncharacterized protein (DUF58 family)